jgi:hypothetical protein
MDPYLEHPQVWPDVHASFIVYLREYLRLPSWGRVTSLPLKHVFSWKDLRPTIQ